MNKSTRSRHMNPDYRLYYQTILGKEVGEVGHYCLGMCEKQYDYFIWITQSLKMLLHKHVILQPVHYRQTDTSRSCQSADVYIIKLHHKMKQSHIFNSFEWYVTPISVILPTRPHVVPFPWRSHSFFLQFCLSSSPCWFSVLIQPSPSSHIWSNPGEDVIVLLVASCGWACGWNHNNSSATRLPAPDDETTGGGGGGSSPQSCRC